MSEKRKTETGRSVTEEEYFDMLKSEVGDEFEGDFMVWFREMWNELERVES